MATTISSDRLQERAADHVHQDFVKVRAGHTVREALAGLQAAQVPGRIVYFYAVDEADRLVGVVPTRALLLSPPETRIEEVMLREVIALSDSATLLEACEFFTLHRLLALPVVEGQGRMLGVIDVELYTDEITDLVRREQSDDVFQLIGIRLAQVRGAPLGTAFRRRFPWLLCNIGGGLACAGLAAAFAGVLEQAVVLALFIPVILTVAESVSIQSLTLTLQAHHGLRFRARELLTSLRREAGTGGLLGLACGALVAGASWPWHGRGGVVLVLGATLLAAVSTAACLGLAVPAVLGAFRRDPKVASGPIALALTDLATLFYYLGLAAWILA